MKAFVYRLLPPRADFMSTMSEPERDVMTAHAGYWNEHMRAGRVLAFGPVADPVEGYGLGIVLAEDIAGVEALRAGDPAVTAGIGLRAEIAPMLRLVTPTGVY